MTSRKPYLSLIIAASLLPNLTIDSAAQKMPLGIPIPPFGLNETVESIYGDSQFYTHWVDNTHPNATDTNNPNGSPTTPRLSIPVVSDLAAGSVVQVRGGPYSGGILTLGGQGTPESPIFFRGSAYQPVLFKRGIRVRNSKYLVVENLQWRDVGSAVIDFRTGAVGEEVAYVALRNCEGTGIGVRTGGSAVGVAGATDSPVHHLVLANNSMHDFGNYLSDTENDCHAFAVAGHQHHIWYLWNKAFHNSGDGIGNGHDANHTTDNLYIGGNTLYENRENAIDLKEVHDVVISGNTCYGYTQTSSSEGASIVVHYGPTTGQGPYNIWILGNRIFSSKIGIISSEIGDTWWIANTIYNCGIALAPDRGGGNVRLLGNTVYNCGTGILSSGTLDRIEIRNNAIVNTSAVALKIESADVRAVSVTSNNLFFNSTAPLSITWGATYSSVARWHTATGAAPDSVEYDPEFADTAALDLTPRVGNPANSAGTSLTEVSAFFERSFGVPLFGPIESWSLGASFIGIASPGILQIRAE